MQVRPFVPGHDEGPKMEDILTNDSVRRGAALQAALILVGQFTDGDALPSDVVEFAQYIDTGAVA